MKKYLPLVSAMLLAWTTYSQEKSFLKNYKAPDFKYKELTGTLRLSAAGSSMSNDVYRGFLGDNRFRFRHIANSQKYQGTLSIYVSNRLERIKTEDYGVDKLRIDYSGEVQSQIENRFYISPKWFIGLHGRHSAQMTSRKGDFFPEGEENYSVRAKPTLSVGFGRVEPVSFARKAMDIEFLFKRSGILTGNMTEDQRKELSDAIADVSNRRYFDVRLGLIDRLEAIDSVIGDIGLVSKKDIAYYTRLQDAYRYSLYNERQSGIRHELGAVQGVTYLKVGSLITDSLRFEPRAFYRFNLFLPSSYMTQHDFNTTLIAGRGRVRTTYWLSSGYSLGIYPNTRTEIRIGFNAGASYDSQDLGYGVSGFSNIYYYISPRLRVFFRGDVTVGEKYEPHRDVHISAQPSIYDAAVQSRYSAFFGFDFAIF